MIGATVTETLATRRSTAAADSILAGAIPSRPHNNEDAMGAPILRQPPAHGSIADSTRVQHRGGSPIHTAPARRPHRQRPPPSTPG